MLLSLFTVCRCSWVEKEEEEMKVTGRGGGQPSCLCLPAWFNCLPSGDHTPRLRGHGCQWVGEAGSHTGNRKSWEREEAMGVRGGGGGHDVQQLPLLVWENNRKRKWKFVFSVPITSPCTKEDVSPHRGYISALLPTSQHTHIPTATVTVTTAQRELPLSLFCYQIRGVQTRHSPRYDSTRCHLWKTASPLNTLSSMKGRQNSGSHTPPCFLSFCLLLSSYLFEADDCLLLQGLYQVSGGELHTAHTCSWKLKKYFECDTVCGLFNCGQGLSVHVRGQFCLSWSLFEVTKLQKSKAKIVKFLVNNVFGHISEMLL